ncbi:DUF6036 family nucleotidyltransferase [Cellulomonas sp. NPDC055163]
MTQLFDREAILGALTDLAARLADGDVATRICVVGGAALAISRVGNRESTTDIDVAVYGNQTAVMAHVRAVAEARGWQADWVNNAVVQFWPFSGEPRWTPVVGRAAVEILVAPADMLLAMKLNAGRGRRDSGDIAALLEVCRISTVGEAEDVFQRYYPGEEMKDRARAQVVAAFAS